MRLPYWIAAALAVLGVGITGGYYLALYIQEQYAALLAGAIIFGILTWLGSATDLLGFIRDWRKDKKEGENTWKAKMRIHTKNLNNEVFRKLLDVQLEVDRKGKLECKVPIDSQAYSKYKAELMIFLDRNPSRPEFMPVEQMPYFNRGIAHLQHYPAIYQAWEHMKEVARENNELSIEVEQGYDSAIKSKMKEYFPSFADRSSETSKSNNYYHTKRIFDFIFQTVAYYNKYQENAKFQHIVKSIFAGKWVITGYGDILIESPSEKEIDTELMQRLLLEIVDDQTLLEKLKNWIFLLGVEIYSSDKNFTTLLKELIDDIDDIEDDYLIEGECERCPKRN